MKPLVTDVENKIRNLLRNGKTTREIASLVHVSQSSVQRVRNKCGRQVTKNVGGRPPTLTPRDNRKIVRYLATGEATSTAHAAKLLQEDTGTSVSKWTVQRTMHKNHFRAIEKIKEASTK